MQTKLNLKYLQKSALEMFSEEDHALKMFVRPHGHTSCISVSNIERKHSQETFNAG